MQCNLFYRTAVQLLHTTRKELSGLISSRIQPNMLMIASISPIFERKGRMMVLSMAETGNSRAVSGMSEKGKCMSGCAKAFGLLTVVLVAILIGHPVAAAEAPDKAEFIAKLIDFVEWPSGKATDASGAVVIACVGDSPVIGALEGAASAKSAQGTKVTVKKMAAGDPLAGCQMVFIGTCDKAELAKVMKAAAGQPVLTVSNCTKFAQFGVMVNIVDDSDGGSKVKFEVNTMTVKEAGLKIGAQLLKLATVI